MLGLATAGLTVLINDHTVVLVTQLHGTGTVAKSHKNGLDCPVLEARNLP